MRAAPTLSEAERRTKAPAQNAPAWTAAQRQRPRRQVPPDTRALKLAPHARRRSNGANRRGNEGLFKTGDREVRRSHVQHVSRTVPLTVKLSGRPEVPRARQSAITLSAHEAPTHPSVHGPLQRLLEVRPTGYHCARAALLPQPQ